MLLQRRLEVLPGETALLHIGQLRTELPRDEGTRLLDATVEIDGRDERFVAVSQQRQLAAAARFLLATPQEQVVAERQPLGLAAERCGRHQRRLYLRLLPFVVGGKFAEQHVGDDEAEHRVAEELERLVVGDAAADILVGTRRVGHGVLEQAAVAEPVLDGALQLLEFVTQADHLSGLQFGAMAFDDASRFLGFVRVDGEAHLSEITDSERKDRPRQAGGDDRHDAVGLQQPADDVGLDR